MRLTQQQKDMLNGKNGQGIAIAMKIQVAIGESFYAERMVPITRAHVALSNQEADLWFAEKLLDAGAKCKIAPTVNPGFCLSYFTNHGMVDNSDANLMQRTHDAYKSLGAVLSYNCTPYLGSNVPQFGEITAFSESSATPYINSVWGAR
ncbi:MAG: aconitase X, partial [Desulfocapsaceae bacterium]